MIELNDNYVKADDLIYEAYLLLVNGDSPLSERDRVYAEEINKLGARMINSFSAHQSLVDLLRSS